MRTDVYTRLGCARGVRVPEIIKPEMIFGAGASDCRVVSLANASNREIRPFRAARACRRTKDPSIPSLFCPTLKNRAHLSGHRNCSLCCLGLSERIKNRVPHKIQVAELHPKYFVWAHPRLQDHGRNIPQRLTRGAKVCKFLLHAHHARLFFLFEKHFLLSWARRLRIYPAEEPSSPAGSSRLYRQCR